MARKTIPGRVDIFAAEEKSIVNEGLKMQPEWMCYEGTGEKEGSFETVLMVNHVMAITNYFDSTKETYL